MARASETSAEVMAMISRAKTWPSRVRQWAAPPTKTSMAAFSMISMPISSMMTLLRQTSTQASPRQKRRAARMSTWASGTIMSR